MNEGKTKTNQSQTAVETYQTKLHLHGSLSTSEKMAHTAFVIHNCLSPFIAAKSPLKQSHSIAKTKQPNLMKHIKCLGQSDKESLFTSLQAENDHTSMLRGGRKTKPQYPSLFYK